MPLGYTWLAGALLLPSCLPAPEEAPRALELRLVRPREAEGVLLNEPLDFFFSAPIDRSSVTQGLRVIDAEGTPVRGELEVDGDHVRFLPAPVLATDLSDGGFRPGTTYVVELRGFPRPDALRSTDGRPLDETRRWWFRTRELGTGPLFGDDTPDRSGSLLLLTPVLGPDEPIVLLSHEEPLDPSTVRGEDFSLASEPGGKRVPVRARLVREFASEREPRPSPSLLRLAAGIHGIEPRAASLLELSPTRTLAPGTYTLRWKADMALADHGGNPVRIARDSTYRVLPLTVVEDLGHSRPGEYHESFLSDAQSWRKLPVPGADGTAYWHASGRIEVRYPAAAGDGRDGLAVLGASELRDDLHATRLELRTGQECLLSSQPGIVVLRSQGRMVISGNLVRKVRTGGDEIPEPEVVPRIDPGFQGTSLTSWLERTRSATGVDRPSWTVLIAGGDLIVEGRVETNTPLLLVAGGMTWVSGGVAGRYRNCWVLGEGRGPNLTITKDADPADLVIDPPEDNPLVEPLRYAVLSAPYPPGGGVSRWKAAKVHGRRNFGSFAVRYVDEGELLDGSPLGAVEDPRSLEAPNPLRMLLELEVLPYDPQRFPQVSSRAWNPPFIDYVILNWD